MSKKPALAARLAIAVEGLLLPSESDRPFSVVYYPNAKLPNDARAFRKLVGLDAATPVKSFDAAGLLARLAKSTATDGADEKKLKRRFAKLADLFANECDELRGFKVGMINVETYQLGSTAEGVVGVKAGGIET